MLTGAAQATAAAALPAVAMTNGGASGTDAGRVTLEVADRAVMPYGTIAGAVTWTIAPTLNVYARPLVRPVIVQLSVVVEQVRPPGDEVAM